MKLYSYVITRDYGFAPNPYYGCCTLATCKPFIRRYAGVGDWVAAFGGAALTIHEKMVMLMRVDETITFDQYWKDRRFLSKRPSYNKGMIHMYGDNIYHYENDSWIQSHSHHSMPNGDENSFNLKRDTQTDRVLIAHEFYYFGCNAIAVPCEYSKYIAHGAGFRKFIEDDNLHNFINYVVDNYDIGIYGAPYSWSDDRFTYYSGK